MEQTIEKIAENQKQLTIKNHLILLPMANKLFFDQLTV